MSETVQNCIILFGLSMVPVVELRGAIPAGIAMGISPMVTWLISVVGNMVPVPFIILFIRAIFEWIKKRGGFPCQIVEHMEEKADKNSTLFYRYELLGLCILVAIPLPGTGAWTGALVAAMLRLRMRSAIPAIGIGVCIAGIIMLVLSCGVDFVFNNI